MENDNINQQLEPVDSHELIITHIINAPRNLVWQAWSESERLAKWWGPKDFKMQVINLDFRSGGIFRYSMVSPEGQKMWGKFMYHEIIAPDKIVFVDSFSDEKGNVVRHPFDQNWPLEVINTMTLTEHDDKTILTLRGEPINANELERKTFEEGRESMQQGFAGIWEQLDEYLAK